MHFSVRLVGGTQPNEGRVQVYYNGWKSVCGDEWDFPDARVTCRQLGYSDALLVRPFFGPRGRQEVTVLNNIRCLGEEVSLKYCASDFGNLECPLNDVASVVCTGKNGLWYYM